jgi:hypothetical protein
MPYAIRRYRTGFRVVNTETGRTYSSRPMTRANAEAQMRILVAAEK